MIPKEMGGDSVVALPDISEAETSDFGDDDRIIIGCPGMWENFNLIGKASTMNIGRQMTIQMTTILPSRKQLKMVSLSAWRSMKIISQIRPIAA